MDEDEDRPAPDDPLMLVAESALARKYGKSPRTLQRWRRHGYGPPHLRIGGAVFYRVGDIREFEERQRRGGETRT